MKVIDCLNSLVDRWSYSFYFDVNLQIINTEALYLQVKK